VPRSGSDGSPSGLRGYSRALYSNWLWHRPLNLLVDAGEGVSLALGSSVFAPSVVAITHGHSDHTLGLPGFAGARRFGKGASQKPWTVLYPEGSSGVEAVRESIAAVWRGVVFPISWVALRSGAAHALSTTRLVEAFSVTHVPGEPTLGYRVVERRRRLQSAYASLPTGEIEQLVRRQGRDALMEAFTHVVFAHSGDAMGVDVELVRDADLLVHDATFLGSEERREPIHATSEEVFALASTAGVRTLVLQHLSIRYDRAIALPRLQSQLAASGFNGDCWLLDEASFVNLR